MSPISPTAFQNTLQAATTQQIHTYTTITSITIRWEKDDTKAHKVTPYFKNILQTLNLPPAIEHIIRHSHSHPNPNIPFQKAIHDILAKSKPRTKNDHNLLIVHYAGHAFTKNGQLTFAETATATSEKTVNADTYLLKDVRAVHLDTLLILDYCYIGNIPTRAATITNRVVEILAATSTQTPRNRISSENTFTAKLAEEIDRRQRSGHTYIEFPDVFQTLKSHGERDKLRPTHALLVGVGSVVLPLSGSGTVDPGSIAPVCTVLFSVSVTEGLTKEEMRDLRALMRKLPCYAGLELDRVYPGKAMCLVLRSALSVYTKLHRVQGYSLIAEGVGAPIEIDCLV
ncbi:hypothetical protein BO83DRAFT_451238 [Aspergillus eucalypticola CBS 122712]|uniref:Uncharacterized protein n=1 Tax=Aspergillus eucalypticola (strain CBS 122712 / IBT 29274) TaxID=1448314 RepID=A0A317V3W6_ASPEC|nr:uncharacterized protein BO83DRAFT_451238 [Aspergillus eucalypticola CBS 122712]PWY66890.1 hypothetical protein BO83DRAFT_451238 [Aspergillus eucalypticola CBS 122712]